MKIYLAAFTATAFAAILCTQASLAITFEKWSAARNYPAISGELQVHNDRSGACHIQIRRNDDRAIIFDMSSERSCPLSRVTSCSPDERSTRCFFMDYIKGSGLNRTITQYLVYSHDGKIYHSERVNHDATALNRNKIKGVFEAQNEVALIIQEDKKTCRKRGGCLPQSPVFTQLVVASFHYGQRRERIRRDNREFYSVKQVGNGNIELEALTCELKRPIDQRYGYASEEFKICGAPLRQINVVSR